MKRVLAIEDLSCLGKCSLTVALPILSAMGHSCTVLPTAVLSSHTGFAGPHIHPMTEHILPIAEAWQSAGAVFDGISVGYLSDPEQAECVMEVLDKFKSPVLLDPVLGDHGKLYSGITESHVDAMKNLCRKARVLLPNLTEAAILTGLPYRENPGNAYLQELLERLMTYGPEGVVITGTGKEEHSTGFVGISRETGLFIYETEKIPRQLHGTGDMFAAVTLGNLVKGHSLLDASTGAAHFAEEVLRLTPREDPFGANFEQALPILWKK